MQKIRIVLFLGVWIVILPYLGFSYSWKDVFMTLSGLGLVYVGFLLYKESKIGGIKEEKPFDNFRENEFKEEEKGEVEEEN